MAADYEADFQESWHAMESHFASQIILFNRSWLTPIYRFIYIGRVLEYDRQLRAGLQLDSLVLSRSREHGLRPEQHAIRFSAIEQKTIEVTYYDETPEPKTITVDLVTDGFVTNSLVEEMLDRLIKQPVD